MQVLKDEVKSAILSAACHEFLEKGYDRASMRNIAAHAGVSTGNLYRYYSNKEELFYAITTPVYNRLLALSEHPSNYASAGTPLSLAQVIEQIGLAMSGLLLENRKEMLILLDGSARTKYADAKEQILSVFAQHVEGHLIMSGSGASQLLQSAGQTVSIAARPLAVSFLEGLFEIMRLYEDEQLIAACTMQYVGMLFQGLGKLLR